MPIQRIQSFQPVVGKDPRILILGSMPGQASLAAGQYYAHRQNSFWRIMAQLLQIAHDASYEKRIESIKNARIAVWDVLHSCVREGSLDARIEADTQITNDFRSFFRAHRQISHVFFNGAKAETCFRQHVLPQLDDIPLVFLRLPSTSPANAASTYAEKLDKWRAILPPLRPESSWLETASGTPGIT